MRVALGALLLFMALAGSASAKPFPREQPPSPTQGYVGGNFTMLDRQIGIAITLTNQDSHKRYILPFTTNRMVRSGANETVMIELPPGTYRVTEWMVYNPLFGTGFAGREFARDIAEGEFAPPFPVKAGEVVFLGRFLADGEWSPGVFYSTTTGMWHAQPLSPLAVTPLLTASYPKFSSVTVACLLCLP